MLCRNNEVILTPGIQEDGRVRGVGDLVFRRFQIKVYIGKKLGYNSIFDLVLQLYCIGGGENYYRRSLLVLQIDILCKVSSCSTKVCVTFDYPANTFSQNGWSGSLLVGNWDFVCFTSARYVSGCVWMEIKCRKPFPKCAFVGFLFVLAATIIQCGFIWKSSETCMTESLNITELCVRKQKPDGSLRCLSSL